MSLKITCVLAVFVALAIPVHAEEAVAILKKSKVKGGLIVHLGCGNGKQTAALRVGAQFQVHGLSTRANEVDAARRNLREKGIYGPVSVGAWDGRHLPYRDNLVNLIVGQEPEKVSKVEVLRVLAPGGVAFLHKGNEWQTLSKRWPEQMDEWTHYFHGPDGNPVANDKLVGPPQRLQWLGSPRWSRHHDHMASLTSMVSAGGRLFYIIDEGPTASIQLPSQWRLVARDAFNGTILWKREIDRWNTRQYALKSGPAHLLRRLVAVGERVYVTLGIDAPVTALDAATGRTLVTYEGSQHTREIVATGDALFLVAENSNSKLPKWRRVSTYVWDNTRAANSGWSWNGEPRKLLAYSAGSGKKLWKVESPVAPCSLAVEGNKLVFHDGRKLVCLERASGSAAWKSEPAPARVPVFSNTGIRVLIFRDLVLYAGNNGKMSGWSLKDGRKLWEKRKRPSGHLSLQDLFIVQGLAWTGNVAGSKADGLFTGYDPSTGEVKREVKADVQVHWFHHRCYPAKAAGKYLLTSRNGTEFIDLTTRHWKPHHWVRGGCIFGVMPSNGMLYAPMDACGCQLQAKLTGLKALAPGPVVRSYPVASPLPRLQKGPAFNSVKRIAAGPEDWPTFRHDEGRSGAASTTLTPGLGQVWQARPGGRLTAPVVAAGRVFVASIDTHTLFALDEKTGKIAWQFTAGARIDSPPTYSNGLALFGSADGSVYALRAADGALAWRFRAAPVDQRMMAWEQLESAWPVHGSVLVHRGVLYCTAGRNMYLEGGIHFIRLDPLTGKLLGETIMDDKDPVSGRDMHLAYLKKTPGNTMPVAHSDVLSCDGKHIWMRSQKIDFQGKRLDIALKPVNEQDPEDFHLFCQNGFLDDTYFFRSYWTFGRRVTGGYGGWFQAGRLVPSGRILCFDAKRIYGFGREPQYMVNSSVLEYQLFATDKKVAQEAIEEVRKAERKINARSSRRNANASDWRLRSFFPTKELSAARFEWTFKQPAIIVRAMAVVGPQLFVAGPPNLVNERRAYHLPDDPKIQTKLVEQAEAYAGRRGGQLWALDAKTGEAQVQYPLDTMPVFDGLAAANRKLYMATADGRVICFGGSPSKPMARLPAAPATMEWDQPEDPKYLLPPPVRKESDFSRVSKCQVFESKLGYRLRANGKKVVGLAVKKLDKPITGSVTFHTRMKAVQGAKGLLRNGFVVFGAVPTDAGLIKCGARLHTQKAYIIQGPLKKGKAKGADVKAPDEKGVEVTVKVDLNTQKIIYTANGVTIESSLLQPLKAITYVGYSMDSAAIDFGPVDIQRP